MKKKIISLVLGACLVFNTAPAYGINGEPEVIGTTPITSGAVLKNYIWDMIDGRVKISVIEADLTNPYLDLQIIAGNGRLGERANVSQMAQNTGAVAAINGDLYNTRGEGSPISTTLIDGELVTSPCVIPGIYALGIDDTNTAYIEQFNFSGTVTAANGQIYPISGLNKAWYWEFPAGVHSHVDKLHVYSDMWGAATRGQDDYAVDIAEVMVQNGIVTAISPEGYFDMAVPEGCYILRAQGLAKIFLLENVQVGDSIAIDYQLDRDLNWQTIIGGDGILVDNGQMVDYGKSTEGLNGVRARTAIGISQDGKKLYLVGVEGRTSDSRGLTLGNLSLFLSKIGVYKAINLDGGGSTTMVNRPLGEFTTVQTFAVEGHAAERRVVEGIGLYSKAPIGSLNGLILSGESRLLVGETANYQVKAYDEYYNPLLTGTLALNYDDSNHLGTWQNNMFTAEHSGATVLSVANGNIRGIMPIEILGKEGLKALTITAANSSLTDGSSTQLTVTATLMDNTTKTVAPNVLTWTIDGFTGSVSPEGVLTVADTTGNNQGTITADYEGFTAAMTIALDKSEKLNLLNTLDGLVFEKTPAAVTGGLTLAADPAASGSNVVKMDYNFGTEEGSVAAYLRFEKGIIIGSGIDKVCLDVYGNYGDEWLRAEIIDGNGQLQRINLASNVDWFGWRQVSFNPQELGLSGPFTLERIYVVETENIARNQTQSKSLYFKNIQTVGHAERGASMVTLTIGSNEMYKDDQLQVMDTVPQIINDRTMVPVRFISEAFGAEILWRSENQTAVIVQNDTVLEIAVDQPTMSLNGQSIAIDVPAQLLNDRTMVPLRAISEGMGMTVDYDSATQKIYIVR